MSELLSFQQVCDSVPMGIVILTGEYRVVYWNLWLEQKTGIPVVQATGKTLKELYPDFENKRFTWAMENVLNNHSPQIMSQSLNHFLLPIPINNRGRHGLSLMQQHVQIAPVPGPQGNTLAMISIQDVTENVIRSSAYTELAQKLMEDSSRDPLTGVYNRRFMWDWLLPQLKLISRAKTPLACLMMDIDHFKKVNDQFGHTVGDKVLVSFVGVVNYCLRESDMLVRYGGEEFAAFLPGNDLKGGVNAAERILNTINTSCLASFDAGRITCSIGVSSWDCNDPCTGEDLLKAADKHLYKAKNNGRNQVAPIII